MANNVWVDWGRITAVALSSTTINVTVTLEPGYYFQPVAENIKVLPVSERPTTCTIPPSQFPFKTTAGCSTSGGSGWVLVDIDESYYTCGATPTSTTIYLWVHMDGTSGGVSLRLLCPSIGRGTGPLGVLGNPAGTMPWAPARTVLVNLGAKGLRMGRAAIACRALLGPLAPSPPAMRIRTRGWGGDTIIYTTVLARMHSPQRPTCSLPHGL